VNLAEGEKDLAMTSPLMDPSLRAEAVKFFSLKGTFRNWLAGMEVIDFGSKKAEESPKVCGPWLAGSMEKTTSFRV
jgi:hypothetical protein